MKKRHFEECVNINLLTKSEYHFNSVKTSCKFLLCSSTIENLSAKYLQSVLRKIQMANQSGMNIQPNSQLTNKNELNVSKSSKILRIISNILKREASFSVRNNCVVINDVLVLKFFPKSEYYPYVLSDINNRTFEFREYGPAFYMFKDLRSCVTHLKSIDTIRKIRVVELKYRSCVFVNNKKKDTSVKLKDLVYKIYGFLKELLDFKSQEGFI